MSGAVIISLILLHFVFGLVQIAVNQAGGGNDCVDVGNFACGAPVLSNFVELSNKYNATGGSWSQISFFWDALWASISGFISLVFFNYGWLHSGGTIIDTIVLLIRLITGGILMGVIARMAVNRVSGLG